ncbi:V-set domain-containing T-cell activation inhibitor 1 isoform X1 [Sebastes fasciatus]|uniref:V-set domain-containing T-cell activation inhibitor 1 isoform X1 n=1 Tax=Sebastes fasciatus TaxID=394691 RepID=UPI003D9E3E74
MATLRQIIFYSMITLIVIFAALIILILSLSFSGTLSELMSSNTSPTANLGEDVLLSCILNKESGQTKLSKVSVTWMRGLTEEVYRYKNRGPALDDQNSQFKGRAQLFPDALVTGNASLLLRDTRRSDEGMYTCSFSSSGGGGWIKVHLRVAAFSAPTFKFSNGVLTAEASRWFPKPNVTWTDFEGKVLSGSTSFAQNSAGIFSVVSTLPSLNISGTYTCMIQNDLVTAVSAASITATGNLVSSCFYKDNCISIEALKSKSNLISYILLPGAQVESIIFYSAPRGTCRVYSTLFCCQGHK